MQEVSQMIQEGLHAFLNRNMSEERFRAKKIIRECEIRVEIYNEYKKVIRAILEGKEDVSKVF